MDIQGFLLAAMARSGLQSHILNGIANLNSIRIGMYTYVRYFIALAYLLLFPCKLAAWLTLSKDKNELKSQEIIFELAPHFDWSRFRWVYHIPKVAFDTFHAYTNTMEGVKSSKTKVWIYMDVSLSLHGANMRFGLIEKAQSFSKYRSDEVLDSWSLFSYMQPEIDPSLKTSSIHTWLFNTQTQTLEKCSLSLITNLKMNKLAFMRRIQHIPMFWSTFSLVYSHSPLRGLEKRLAADFIQYLQKKYPSSLERKSFSETNRTNNANQETYSNKDGIENKNDKSDEKEKEKEPQASQTIDHNVQSDPNNETKTQSEPNTNTNTDTNTTKKNTEMNSDQYVIIYGPSLTSQFIPDKYFEIVFQS